MSIIYSTLERLENLEKLESQDKKGSAPTDPSAFSTTRIEPHPAALPARPAVSRAFKVVVSLMLCLGVAAMLLVRTEVPTQLYSSLFSRSQPADSAPSVDKIPGPIVSATTTPVLPALVTTVSAEADWRPVAETASTTEPETQFEGQMAQFDMGLEAESEPTPARLVEVNNATTSTLVVEVDSVETVLVPVQAPELPSEVAEEVLEPASTEIALADASPDLAQAEQRPGNEQPADAQLTSETSPAIIATTAELRPDPIGQALEQARLALARGQYFQALSVMESIPTVPENRADFWLIKGSVHLGLGQLDLAEESFASALALVPGHAHTLVQLAVVKQEKGDHAGAVGLLQNAALTHREVPEIYLNLGYSQQALGEIDDAARSFNRFLELTEGRTVYLEQREMVGQWFSERSAAVSSVVGAR